MIFRSTFIAVILSLIACGDKKEDPAVRLDLIGKTESAQKPDLPGAAETPSTQPLFTVDLIHDLTFRMRRDGWTLLTPEADVNLQKLESGGVNLLVAAIPVEGNATAALDSGLADLKKLLAATGDKVRLVQNMSQTEANRARGIISVMVMLEGADGTDRMNAADLMALRAAPVHVISLLSPKGNALGGGFGNPGEGLSPRGAEWVQNAREAGIAVNLTFSSESTFWDVLVNQGILAMVSHSACRFIREHPRNLTDLQILALARYGGLLGIVFNPDFIRQGDAQATIDDVVRHFVHARQLGAVNALAIGSDFNGIIPPIGLKDVSALPTLRNRLLQAGFSEEEVRGVFGENARRYFDAVEIRQGSAEMAATDLLRPIPLECDNAVGEYSGVLSQSCDHYLLTPGPTLEATTRQRFRVADIVRKPQKLEIFGVPGTPWQVEAQNLEGKVIVHRSVLLDHQGHGEVSMPANQNLTRFFLFPTRPSRLSEAILWGR